MESLLCRLWVEEEGQTLVEYSLVIALIALAVVSAIGYLGGRLQTKYSIIHNSI